MCEQKQPIIYKIDFIIIFVLSYLILNVVLNSFWYFLLIVTTIAISIFFHVKWWKLLIYVVISFIPLGIYYLIGNFNLFSHLRFYLDSLLHFSLRNTVLSFVNHSYDQLTSGVIKLLIFNVKSSSTSWIYQSIINLSIVHLFIISGFHLSLIRLMFLKLFKQWKIIGEITSLVLILFFTYFLNFSIPTMRVIISIIIGYILKRYKVSTINIVAIGGLITLLIAPISYRLLGFLLSYACTIGIIYIYQFEFKYWLVKQLMVNFFAIIISLPIVLMMNQQISLFALINSFIFSYFILLLFFVLMFSFWMTFISVFVKYEVIFLINVIKAFGLLNILIKLNWFNDWMVNVYYSGLLLIVFTIKKYINYE